MGRFGIKVRRSDITKKGRRISLGKAESIAARKDFSSVERRIIVRELKQGVDSAIKRLPLREQNIVKLYFFHGFTHEEIAEHEKISRTRVSQIISKSLSLLRRNPKLVHLKSVLG